MIREFKELMMRDRGSKGDAQGRLKLRAAKELSYVYLMEDFLSPFANMDYYKRHKQALHELGLSEADIDDKVLAARDKYAFILKEHAPMLRTLEIVKQSREQLEDYFKEIDLSRTNSKGELVYNAPAYINMIKQLPAMEDAIREYEEKVYAQLLNDKGIRGKAEKGFNEGKVRELQERAGEDTEIDNGPQLRNPLAGIKLEE